MWAIVTTTSAYKGLWYLAWLLFLVLWSFLKTAGHNTKRMDEGWGQELHILGRIIQPLRRMLMGHRPLAFEEVGPHVTSEDVTGKASAGPVSWNPVTPPPHAASKWQHSVFVSSLFFSHIENYRSVYPRHLSSCFSFLCTYCFANTPEAHPHPLHHCSLNWSTTRCTRSGPAPEILHFYPRGSCIRHQHHSVHKIGGNRQEM